MNVVLLTSDLTVVSRVQGAAARRGATLRTAGSQQQALDACQSQPVEMVIIDLAMPSLDVGGVVDQLRAGESAAARIVAFGPHVHEERLAAARQAGCDEVVSRGQFFAQLEGILGRHQAD
jgi:CheY-like chemotaxis protein